MKTTAFYARDALVGYYACDLMSDAAEARLRALFPQGEILHVRVGRFACAVGTRADGTRDVVAGDSYDEDLPLTRAGFDNASFRNERRAALLRVQLALTSEHGHAQALRDAMQRERAWIARYTCCERCGGEKLPDRSCDCFDNGCQ